jgi:hypothetical protein
VSVRLGRMAAVLDAIERDGDMPGPALERRMHRRLDDVQRTHRRIETFLEKAGCGE